MTLIEFKRQTGLSFRQLAELVGFDVAQVHRWATGERDPTLAVIRNITEATDGKVTVLDFLRSSNEEAA